MNEQETAIRVVHVDLMRLEKPEWEAMRDAARMSAIYANWLIAARMAELLGCPPPADRKTWDTFVRAKHKARLMSYVNDAVRRDVMGQWGRHRARIAAGLQQPPWYNGSVVIVRDTGVKVIANDDGYAVRASILTEHEAFVFPIEKNAARDTWLVP